MIKKFDIYSEPDIYDDQYWWKKDDIEFYKTIIPPRAKALELGAGTGRLAIPLLRHNVDFYGLELSPTFCNHANNIISRAYDSDRIIKGDMIDFKLDMDFDYIFIAFNSFLHILTDKDATACLQSIYKHLNSGGKFILDILVPHPHFLYRKKNDELPVMDFKDSKSGELVEIFEESEYDNESQICNISWIYKYQKSSKKKVFNYQMRMYYPDTINRLLIDGGFKISNMYGDHTMGEFREDSHLQIYICQK